MVLGTTYYHAARYAGSGWNRPGFLPAFRNGCLALLALAASVVAGTAGSPSAKKDGAGTEHAASEKGRSPERMQLPVGPPTETKPETAPHPANKSTSVLLPPITSLPDSDTITPTAKPRPARPSAKSQGASSSLLEPPPSIQPADKPEMDTKLEVIIGQPHVLAFPEVPHRVALIVDEKDPIASLKEVPHRPREWYLIGKKAGTTFLDVWLPHPTNATSDRVVHYNVRILPEGTVKGKVEKTAEKPPVTPPLAKLPQFAKPSTAKPPTEKVLAPKPFPAKPPAELPSVDKPHTEPAHAEKTPQELSTLSPIYQALEQEINNTFPGSTVHLRQVGDKLLVSGTARNLFEGSRILNVAREHAPGAKAGDPRGTPSTSTSIQAAIDNYAHAGGPHVVNLLRIPGEQQIMLRVIVAEVNRSAARSLGLDFGLADKQAAILPSRPANSNNSSTVSHNGWIGEAINTLKDLHYAQILAEPTLTTLNGQAARFKAGGEFPIPVVSPSPQGAVQSVAFRSYGVHLSIQPVLADSNRVRLAVETEVSGTDPQATMHVGGSAVPGLKIRNFESTVELREGETLAVAGLVRNAGSPPTQPSAMPGSANPSPSDQELVVLISPLLLHPLSAEKEHDARHLNPQDIELYLRSRNTMVPRGDALFLIGPQGYAGKHPK